MGSVSFGLPELLALAHRSGSQDRRADSSDKVSSWNQGFRVGCKWPRYHGGFNNYRLFSISLVP